METNLAELAKAAHERSGDYLRQWILWLTVGSALGAAALISFSSSLTDPEAALRFFVPSLWLFLAGIVSGSAGVAILAKQFGALADHFAHAQNRDSLGNAIEKIPEKAAAPRALWERQNAGRLDLIRQREQQHHAAERSWKTYTIWNRLWLASAVAASIGCIGGFLWPLVRITLGHSLLQ